MIGFFSKYILRGIFYYSTAQTPDAAYIIGGSFTRDIIARFKDNQWRRLDDLNKGRYGQSSITIGRQTMIIGGANTNDE